MRSLSVVPVALSLVSLVNAVSLEIATIEAHFTNAGLVPSFLPTFDPVGTLNITYPTVGTVGPGQALTKDQVGAEPQLTTKAANSSVAISGNYTLIMADADIVGADESGGQTRHWLANNVVVTNGNVAVSVGQVITNYAGPGPAPGSGAHRYVILLYGQPDDFIPPANLSQPNTPVAKFDVNQYVNQAGLFGPVAANYFTVQEGTPTVSVSATQPVNTASLAASLSAAGSGSASAASATASAGSTSTGQNSAASALDAFTTPIAFVATLLGLLFI